MGNKNSNIIEHNVNDESLLEKAFDFHKERLLNKRFTRLEKLLKNKLYEKVSESEEGLVIGDKKKVGMFTLSLQEQKRDEMTATKKLCYELGFNPESYKNTSHIEAVSPSYDNGLYTYIQYEQLNKHLRNHSEDYKELDNSISSVLSKEDPSIEEVEAALETVWAFRKSTEDNISEVKKEFKKDIQEYIEKPDGFNPQSEHFYFNLNENITFGSYEMHIFNPKKFLQHLKELSDNPEHPSSQVIINKGYQVMEKDIEASSAERLLAKFHKKLSSEQISDIAEIKNSDSPENAYEYILNNIDDEDIVNDIRNNIKEKKNDMENKDPVEYLLNSVKKTSLIVKLDPPRGYKTPEAQHKNQMLLDAQESIKVLKEYSKGAQITSLVEINNENEISEANGQKINAGGIIENGIKKDKDNNKNLKKNKSPSLSLSQ